MLCISIFFILLVYMINLSFSIKKALRYEELIYLAMSYFRIHYRRR